MTASAGNGGNAAGGCGCLLLGLIILGAIGASCGSSQSTPTVITPTTTTTTPYYYYAPPSTTSSYTPPTSTSAASSGSYDDDDDYDRPYVPAPSHRAPGRTHSGNSGHPCLPGERDGDNDGYCGEGR